ncbi:MAG: Unknown protein [uncultured Thiotrichaceae bacterium]|uniref:Uncharacterized protein n=1 Tax=uncultured Thiotrichaceae bacterium TaxID=298394 RepID=A0A6S6UE75_9GAMM|nr:MAG: Unknown protein [uncultured Thiotrichaceae bacterium]
MSNNQATPEPHGNVEETPRNGVQSSNAPGIAENQVKLEYLKEQLKQQSYETAFEYQQRIEKTRLEYQNLLKQQEMLHESGIIQSQQNHEKILKQQELQKEYLRHQQNLDSFDKEKTHEVAMADRLIAFETRKQLLKQQHEEALVVQNDNAFKQSLMTYSMVISFTVLLLSISYYLVSARAASKQRELVRLEQEHIYALKQQESMQETRIKVLESISDLPEKDKKEIIVGLVGLNRPFEELEEKRIQEPPIEIELTELTPPQLDTRVSSTSS